MNKKGTQQQPIQYPPMLPLQWHIKRGVTYVTTATNQLLFSSSDIAGYEADWLVAKINSTMVNLGEPKS